ncbi:hypothetical protein DL764_007973 [Monosporascus ibericus]|uniref:Uncharacterized protein n=1 Tax=Monosporascus ibericus TaxID=155417 RepID=A0A4Q4SYP5_9PEZI|nr:hypothetical protein DL764_007973 [Monosporascus ibericus]
MLSFPKLSIYQSPKCSVTYGTMGHPDPKQLPVKGKPWSALLAQDFVHEVDLILPQDLVQVVKDKIARESRPTPTYSRVIMTLGHILEGDFFTEYIKIGNIIMLSEGRVDAENVFSLKDGLLTMYLDKETYERAGLVGKPYGVKGRRGLKPRWIVEFDLRSPSMLHGKKGFDRLVYACKKVFSSPTSWLFCNLSKNPSPDPLAKHYQVRYTSAPGFDEDLAVAIPTLMPPQAVLERNNKLELDEYATDVYEWLSLIRLGSPRILASDKVDPYLSTYAVPGGAEDVSEGRLCKVSWEGFISSAWTRQLLADIILALPSKSWFSLSVTTFAKSIVGDCTECTIFRPPDSPGEYFLWDINGHA